jgi:cytochrome c-type biogenesis protein
METGNVTVYLAFTAGLLSFISPCVLPLIPSYVSYITGISFEELTAGEPDVKIRKIILFNSVAFVLGFSLVFIALGATISLLGQYFAVYKDVLRKVGAVFIVFMGLHIIGVVNIKALQRDKRLHLFKDKPLGYIGSFVVGIGFAAGWTPCIGPILASILIVAGASESLGKGIWLLVVYSLGLAVPFLLTSLGINRFLRFFNKFQRQMRVVSVVSGLFLITIGVMIYTNYFLIFTGYLNAWFPFLIYN